jgi:hypothetical protein
MPKIDPHIDYVDKNEFEADRTSPEILIDNVTKKWDI